MRQFTLTNFRASRKWLVIGACALGFQVGLTPNAAAQTQFGNNIYILVLPADPFTGDNNAWVADSLAAAASTYNGVHGHLATVSSQAENDFLLSLSPGFPAFRGAWLGGRSPQGWLEGPESGQAFTYTNWGGIEPNNNGYAYMNIGLATSGIGAGQWADDSGVQGYGDPSFDPVLGYFVEYENAAVPEPTAFIALALGALGLLRRRKSSS